MQNRQTFEDYLLENFNRNEGKYFTKEELINSYKEQTGGQEFMYDSFEKSIIWVNNVLGSRAYYINEKQSKDTEEILYANMPSLKGIRLWKPAMEWKWFGFAESIPMILTL